jgi:hypothetical protein
MKRDDDWNDFFEMVGSVLSLAVTVFELFHDDDDD